jgi:hypothetical protein
LLDAQSSGRRGLAALSLRAIKTREATTSAIWRSRERKPETATWSPPRAITSTPVTISDRCPRVQMKRARPRLVSLAATAISSHIAKMDDASLSNSQCSNCGAKLPLKRQTEPRRWREEALCPYCLVNLPPRDGKETLQYALIEPPRSPKRPKALRRCWPSTQ